MRRWEIVVAGALWLALSVGFLYGCASAKKEAPPPAPPPRPAQLMTPQSRLVFHGGQSIFTVCDRGNRVYVSESGQFQVVAGGCPDGAP